MSKVTKGVKNAVKGIGNFAKGLFKSPSIVVNDNSQQVADAINKQAEDERKAKEEADLKTQREKEYREKVEKDQKELDNMKALGTSENKSSDLASSGLNDVNVDFSKTLMEQEKKKKNNDFWLNALMGGR